MNRALTTTEKDWLTRGLKTLETGEYFGGGNWVDLKTGVVLPDKPVDPQFFLDQIDGLRVTGQCECGSEKCHTVQFQHFESGKIVALVIYHTTDRRMLIIHIHEATGLLAELEII